jgi:GNAT superfamily N-acetyltransferase
MFAQHSDSNAQIGGQWHAFFVDGINALYGYHQRLGASIVSPLEAKPWGLREYTVRDLNGHYLRFGQSGADRPPLAGPGLEHSVRLEERLPTETEYSELVRAVGWAETVRPDTAREALGAARLGVVAMEDGRAVGAGLVLGDGTTFAYLKDIMVHPDRKGRRIGTRIVHALLAMIRRRNPDDMLVALFTGQNLRDFYEQFGFSGPECGLYGMSLKVRRQDLLAAPEAAEPAPGDTTQP